MAYVEAAKMVSGRVLEIGTGTGYGIEVIAPACDMFTTLDKFSCEAVERLPDNAQFVNATVPPLPFKDETFDYVVSFQVIEHIADDKEFVREVHRVLRKGGRFIVTTPNRPMSLTRNPWHVREYTSEELYMLLSAFDTVECKGVVGNERVMAYYEKNRESVRRIMRFDIFRMQWWLPASLLKIPYDIMNRRNRRRLHSENTELTESIQMEDYSVVAVDEHCFDLFYIATK